MFDEPTRLLTVVVPAYNETDRINIMMDEMLAHLQSESKNDRAGRCVLLCRCCAVGCRCRYRYLGVSLGTETPLHARR